MINFCTFQLAFSPIDRERAELPTAFFPNPERVIKAISWTGSEPQISKKSEKSVENPTRIFGRSLVTSPTGGVPGFCLEQPGEPLPSVVSRDAFFALKI